MNGVIMMYRRLLLGTALVLAGCSSNEEQPHVERPATDLYTDAFQNLKDENFKKAADAFDEVERQHPYSEWAVRGQVMAAYASYNAREYDKAIATLDAFAQLHPGYEHIAYVYYLRGLCYYDQILATARDQQNTLEALKALEVVVKRFPDTKYGRDAKFKMDLVYDHLAGKEMEVGRYYLSQKQYLAAVNRFQAVIDAYPRTTHVPEALHRLVESYLALGLNGEAQSVGAVLGHNFPGSDWYADSYLLLQGKDLRPEWTKVEESSWWEKLRTLKFN